ncbi:ScpA family protein [Rhizobium leguminosarum]|uniref:segregation and condensation protein A n=1 Tax=Rhizobium leguminosarum TaxID=384 RepID=UPI002E140383|nr:ScpA family protein [Rhizobium leguminosarum]
MRAETDDEVFIVRFESWEGPIEAMLELARNQKIDLAKIDILELVSQFEHVVDRAIGLRLELAADWLVMAAWLTYLKSRILLRRPSDKKGRSAPDEDVLAFHLRRLAAVRDAAERLPERLQLGRDWFSASGAHAEAATGNRLAVGFHDFIAAYPRGGTKILDGSSPDVPNLKPFDLASVDSAISRLARSIPQEWVRLLELVPPGGSALRLRSNIATSLIAALELCRDGTAQVQQEGGDAPILVRRGAK